MLKWLALFLFIALLASIASLYNRLIQLRNRVNNAWSQIDVELRRRYDLVPQLVETVKGYARHEEQTFLRLTAARSQAVAAGDDAVHRGAVEGQVTAAFRSLFAVAEGYPELQANTQFLQLQKELSQTESRIGFARQFYNETVMMFNTAIEQMPGRLLAGPLGLTPAPYFELADPGLRQAPAAAFNAPGEAIKND